MPSPIPVYITDCVGDCLVIASAAEDLARLGVWAGVLIGMVLAALLTGLLIASGLRR